ncbi:hypothetical protein GOV09_05395 [Candidatus Woesearchaeota archaeon]|nr:hypothetical protein [Candidatus Woesearchaeota archaeon]
MAIEETLLIIKPDAVEKGEALGIIDRLQRSGLEVGDLFVTHPTKGALEEHYEEVLEKFRKKGKEIFEEFYDQLMSYMRRSHVVVARIAGGGAIKQVRRLAGEKTQPIDNPRGTIRRDKAIDSFALADLEHRAMENMVHSSDSKESAKRELGLWFTKYDRPKVQDNGELPIEKYLSVCYDFGINNPLLLREITRVANEKRLLFRTVHNYDIAIRLDGIFPLEDEPTEWHTGDKLFTPETAPSRNFYHDDNGNPTAVLAVASHQVLSEDDHMTIGDYRANGAIEIPMQVPNKMIHYINASSENHGSEQPEEREKNQILDVRRSILKGTSAAILARVHLGTTIEYR